MRDIRFIAEHWGGTLKNEQHRQLIHWAYHCAENVLTLMGDEIDERLINAINVAKEWEQGKASVGGARKASIDAHIVARESTNPVVVAVSRAVGHAAANMANHSLGAAFNAVKGVKMRGNRKKQKGNGRMINCQQKSRSLSYLQG